MYKDLISKVYTNAVNHGWHEDVKTVNHFRMMIITEVAEAVEAHRCDRYANIDAGFMLKMKNSTDEEKMHLYKECIKDTLEDEFADIYIRLLDLAGCQKQAVTEKAVLRYKGAVRLPKVFTERAFEAVRKIMNLQCSISEIIGYIERWAEMENVELLRHIEIKMAINELRPYKHGRKKY